MSRLEIVPFADEHLEDAARLLAARHSRQREAEPLLPERFEDQDAAHDEVAEAWRADGASGAAALRAGRLVGYLVGAPRNPEDWGENIWVKMAGHAVEDAEEIRDLYATAAARWFEEGRRRHYALVPGTHSELMDAIDLALPTHQGSSPIFSPRPLPTADAIRAEWRKTLAGDEERLLIGCLDGKPVACWSVCAAELSMHYSGLGLPERASYLAFASTLSEARGSGIGVALTDASLAAAAADGYRAMVTDWRVTNLLASRFWPKRGFRPTFYRLYRSIP